jgi:hypothetical protein
MSDEEPDDRRLDTYFFYCFRYAAGCALQRSAILQTDFRMIAVSDQEPPNGIAGTNQALSDWHIHDRPIDIIPYERTRPWNFGASTNATYFRPAVFIWPGQSNTNQTVFDDALISIVRRFDSVSRTHRDGRRGICLIPFTIEQALYVASAAVKQSRNKLPLRVICDFGCVLRADNSLDKKLVARLQASDDLLGAPTGQPLSTEAFAMQAKFDLGDKLTLIPIGRAETHLGHQSESEQNSICHRPSLSIYTMRWEKAAVISNATVATAE